MDGVAVRANNVVFCMRRAPDIRAAQGLAVAPQTIVQNLSGMEHRERNDGGFSATCLHMSASRTVAALAPGVFRRFFAGCDAPVVRILVESRPNVGMAGSADIASDIVVGRGGSQGRLAGGLLSYREKREQRAQKHRMFVGEHLITIEQARGSSIEKK